MNVLSRARAVNLGLLVLAMLSLLVTVWLGRLPSSAESATRQQHLLPIFRQEEVQRITVVEGQRRTVIERELAPPAGAGAPGAAGNDSSGERPGVEAAATGAEWNLLEPFETDADPAPVERLLGSLRYATWEREVEGPLDLGAESGAPGAVLSERSIELRMGELSYRLRLGKESPAPAGSRYLEVTRGSGESHVYVIKKSLVDALFPAGESFRGRQIAPYQKRSVEGMVLSSAAGARRLRRVGDNFHFDGMEDGQRVDRAALERVFVALGRAVAEPFLDIEVAKAALSVEPSVRVLLRPSGDKAEASLEFGGTCPTDPGKAVGVRHVPEPLAGCIDKSVVFTLREPASAFIDDGLFSFNADEVDTVRLVEGERVLDFARKGDGFELRAPEAATLDAEAAADRLARILGVSGELYTGERRPRGAEAYDDVVITLESSSRLGTDTVREVVRVGPVLSDGSRRVFREADGAVVAVGADDAFALRADVTLLKQHQVFDYGLRDVRRVRVAVGPVKQALERSEAGGLTLLEPKGFAIDGGLAVTLIDELRSLRALRWVTDRTTGGFGLDKSPRAEVKLAVNVDGRDIERTLRIGRSAPGGYYATVDRDPGVFVVPRSLERTLATWLFDRSVFMAERDSIVELTLNVEGRGKLTLRRVAGQLTVEKSSPPFDLSRLDELLEVIESLRPDAAVHPGPATAGEGFRRPILTCVIRRLSPKNVDMPTIRFSVGSRDSFQDASVYYARHASINATYALPRAQVQRLLDLF